MKLGLLNDTHLGITKEKHLRKCFAKLAQENPDIVIHAGDFCGGTVAYRTVRRTCKLLREALPNTPILAVMGNHDRWCGESPSLTSYLENQEKIKEVFLNEGVSFLDEDGPSVIGNYTFIGNSGWYHERPDSNDWNFLPTGIEGDTHRWLQRQAETTLFSDLDALPAKRPEEKRVFISHFPVVDCNPWDGSPKLGQYLQETVGIDYFISGHSHGALTGPVHFRTATDYYKPEYLIVDI